ncbi:MAG TPA: PAS domain-containing protein [Planctomycetota bacterium]|nr:PAS domain-containing protein [Planctomycetota bacterium]
MKILTWTLVSLALLGHVTTRSTHAGPASSEDAEGPSPTGGRFVEPPPGVMEDVRTAFSRLEAVITRARDEMGPRVHGSITSELKEALSRWEEEPGSRPAMRSRIAAHLRAARDAQRLDLLLVVTQEGEIFSASVEAVEGTETEARAMARAHIVLVAEEYLRNPEPSSGLEMLPVEHAPAACALSSAEASGMALFVAAGAPVWLRPDAPHSTLVGAVAVESLGSALDAALKKATDGLRWHVFVDRKVGGPAVVAGGNTGAAIRRSLYQALLTKNQSEEEAFEGEKPQAGRWALLRSRDNRALGGWGVTADSFRHPGLVVPVKPAGPGPLRGLDLFAEHLVYWVGGATVLSLGVLLVINGSRSRRRRRVRQPVRVMAPADHGRPLVQVPAMPASDDLVSQFEINWKTFASYTQDILHKKLKELEEAPQRGVREVREQVGHLSAALLEIKNDLSAARSEVKDTTHGVVERVAHLVQEGVHERKDVLGQGEVLLRKMETDFDKASTRFSELNETVSRLADMFGQKQDREIEDRVAAEVERLQKAWNERVAAFSAEIEEARKEGQGFLEELTAAKEAQADLQAELERAAAREAELEQALGEASSAAESVTKDREVSWRRERELIEELHTAKGTESELLERASELEQAIARLDAAAADGKAREEGLQRAAEEARASEAKHREAIKEIYREEGRFQKDLEQKEREFEEERKQLVEKLRGLTERNSRLEADGAEDSAEARRLASLQEASERELEALRNALRALKEEKDHFENQAVWSASELEKARADRAASEGTRVHDLESESSRLRTAVADLETRLSREVGDRERVLHSLEVLKADLAEKTEAHAERCEELKALRLDLESKAGEVEMLRTIQAEREEDFSTAKTALEGALQSSFAELKKSREAAGSHDGDARLARERLEKALESSRAEVERLRKAQEEEAKRLRPVEEERVRFKARIAESEAEWRSKMGEVERRCAEAERKAAESERKVSEAEAATRSLDARLGEAKVTSRAAGEASERLRALERERSELATSFEGLGKDLEDLKRETDGLRRFQGALLEGRIPAAIVAVDADLKVFAWNPRAEGLWERSAREASGKLLTDLGLKGAGAELVDLARRALRERKPVSTAQASFEDTRGRKRHLRLHGDLITGMQGEVLGTILIADEVTEEVEHELEATVQGLFSQSLVRSLPAALIVVDLQHRVMSWNGSAETMLGVTEKAALGADFFSLKTPLSKNAFRRYFETSSKDRSSHRVRVRFDSKSAAGQHVLTQAPFIGSDDQVRGTIILLQEATEVVIEGSK